VQVDQFCKRRNFHPKFFIIANVVEKGTWDVLSHMKSDGHVTPKDQAFHEIMSTKIGKIGEIMGEVEWIWATELDKADGGVTMEGPSLIFVYTKPPRKLKKGCFLAS
jgi:hypothetical protein